MVASRSAAAPRLEHLGELVSRLGRFISTGFGCQLASRVAQPVRPLPVGLLSRRVSPTLGVDHRAQREAVVDGAHSLRGEVVVKRKISLDLLVAYHLPTTIDLNSERNG